ncbi:cell division cycle 20, cofactor of APC complex [Enteropsectra breve]|nr:cell division cycle 20, cofactor of APC complex [Enteropsectra breve]
MAIDLSGLFKAASKSHHRSRARFAVSDLFSLPNINERSKRIEDRHIDKSPYKILDAPGIVDDYYLNVLDWTKNRISVALGNTLFSYNTDTNEASEIFSSERDYVSSIKGNCETMAIGDASGSFYIYDYNQEKISYSLDMHQTRICALDVSEKMVVAGSKSGAICTLDTRTMRPTYLEGHTQEVCGLKWNKDYFASGANDNTIRVWRNGSPVSMVLKGHKSAIKALDWCPWKTNILASGGGTKDKTIKFWDTQNGKCINNIEVSSQVCSVNYLSRYKEMVTSHGYQENDLKLWKIAGMKMLSSFGSHEGRILHTALSPDQTSMVSLGSDESLKFWKLSERKPNVYKRDSIGMR